MINAMNGEIEKLISMIEDNKNKLITLSREKTAADNQRIKVLALM